MQEDYQPVKLFEIMGAGRGKTRRANTINPLNYLREKRREIEEIEARTRESEARTEAINSEIAGIEANAERLEERSRQIREETARAKAANAGARGGVPTGTIVEEGRLARETGREEDSTWHVIVENDDYNSFESVTLALSRVIPGISSEKGKEIADSIHQSGKAVVWSGHLEVAEHYWEQLKGYGLTMAPLEK